MPETLYAHLIGAVETEDEQAAAREQHRDVETLDGRGRGRKQTALQGQGRQVRIVLGPLGQALADLRRCAFQGPGVVGRGGSCDEPSHMQDPEQAL